MDKLYFKVGDFFAAGQDISQLVTGIYNFVSEAIDEAEKHGATVVDKLEVVQHSGPDYNALMKEAKELWTKLVHPEDNGDEEMARTILKKIELNFGRPMKISEITEDPIPTVHS